MPMKALILALLLLIPASAQLESEPLPQTVTYMLIGHPCSDNAEWVLLIFADASWMLIPVAYVDDEIAAQLAVLRRHVPNRQVLVRGPYRTCPPQA